MSAYQTTPRLAPQADDSTQWSRVRAYAKLLDLPTQRQLLSLLDGWHLGRRAGSSHEFLDLAEYRVGDEIKNIDWKSTARLGQLIVKRFESTAQLKVLLAVDGSKKMLALARGKQLASVSESAEVKPGWLRKKQAKVVPTSFEIKKRIQVHLATALAFLALEHGDHLGIVLGGSGEVRALPARSGLGHAETVLTQVERIGANSPNQDMAAVLRYVDAATRSRSLIAVITDPMGINSASQVYLKRLAIRHQVMVFIVRDFHPDLLPANWDITDVDLGALPEFMRTDSKMSKAFTRLREQQEEQAARIVQKLKLPWAFLDSNELVLRSLTQVLQGGVSDRT